MHWTKTKPSKPGYYWYGSEVVQVNNSEKYGGFIAYRCGCVHATGVKYMYGEWSNVPIPENTEEGRNNK